MKIYNKHYMCKLEKLFFKIFCISQDGVMVPGVTCTQPICSSSSRQNNSYFHPTKQDISQSSLFSDQNLRQDNASMETSTSSLDQVSANVVNFDNPIIQIRTRKKSSHSDCLVEHQGLAKRQIRLQKFVHKGSAPRTDHVLSTTSSEMVKSVVSKVWYLTSNFMEWYFLYNMEINCIKTFSFYWSFTNF